MSGFILNYGIGKKGGLKMKKKIVLLLVLILAGMWLFLSQDAWCWRQLRLPGYIPWQQDNPENTPQQQSQPEYLPWQHSCIIGHTPWEDITFHFSDNEQHDSADAEDSGNISEPGGIPGL